MLLSESETGLEEEEAAESSSETHCREKLGYVTPSDGSEYLPDASARRGKSKPSEAMRVSVTDEGEDSDSDGDSDGEENSEGDSNESSDEEDIDEDIGEDDCNLDAADDGAVDAGEDDGNVVVDGASIQQHQGKRFEPWRAPPLTTAEVARLPEGLRPFIDRGYWSKDALQSVQEYAIPCAAGCSAEFHSYKDASAHLVLHRRRLESGTRGTTCYPKIEVKKPGYICYFNAQLNCEDCDERSMCHTCGA